MKKSIQATFRTSNSYNLSDAENDANEIIHVDMGESFWNPLNAGVKMKEKKMQIFKPIILKSLNWKKG